jgi:hypothetical protein
VFSVKPGTFEFVIPISINFRCLNQNKEIRMKRSLTIGIILVMIQMSIQESIPFIDALY